MIFQVKKLFVLALSFVLCFNLCAPAFAVETDETEDNQSLIEFGAAIAASIVQGTTATASFIVQSVSSGYSPFVKLLDDFTTADEDIQALYGSGERFAQAIAEASTFSDVGDIIIEGVMNSKIYRFVQWLKNEYSLVPGGSGVSISAPGGRYNYLVDGTRVVFSKTTGTSFNFGTVYETEIGSRFSVFLNGNTATITFIRPDGTEYEVNRDYGAYNIANAQYYRIYGNKTYNEVNLYFIGDGFSAFNSSFSFSPYNFLFSSSGGTESTVELNLTPLPEFYDLPSDVPDDQGLTINTGISDLDTSDPQITADTIFQFIIDGNYIPVVSVGNIPVTYNPQITVSQFSVTSTTFTSSVSLTGFDPSGSYRLYYDLTLSEDVGDTSSSVSKGYSNQIGIVSGVTDYTGYHRFTDLTPNTEYYVAWTVEDMTTGTAVPVVDSITFTTSGVGSSDDSPGILLMILNKVSEIFDKMNGGQSEGILASINDKLDDLIDTVANQYERELEDNFKDSLSGVNESFFSETGKGQGVTVSDVVDLADTQSVFKGIFSGDYGFSDFLDLFSDDGFSPWFSADTAMNLNPTAYGSPSAADLDDPYNMQSYYDNVEKVRNKSDD